eukprot:1159627-Pelagomonas_calceolata.AAC.3
MQACGYVGEGCWNANAYMHVSMTGYTYLERHNPAISKKGKNGKKTSRVRLHLRACTLRKGCEQ